MQDLRTILDIYKSNNDLQVFIDNKKFSNFILLNGLSNVLGSVFFNEDITGIKGIMGLINIINSSKNQEQIVKLSKRLYMSYLLKQIPITSETILDNLNITDQEIDLGSSKATWLITEYVENYYLKNKTSQISR